MLVIWWRCFPDNHYYSRVFTSDFTAIRHYRHFLLAYTLLHHVFSKSRTFIHSQFPVKFMPWHCLNFVEKLSLCVMSIPLCPELIPNFQRWWKESISLFRLSSSIKTLPTRTSNGWIIRIVVWRACYCGSWKVKPAFCNPSRNIWSLWFGSAGYRHEPFVVLVTNPILEGLVQANIHYLKTACVVPPK